MSSNKLLDGKSISELQELFNNTQKLLAEKQDAIRETAVQQIQQIALEAGIKVFIREQKKRGEKSAEKLYRNPDDHSQTWNGKGASPKWIKSSGKDKSEFEVKTETEAPTENA
jgi:DNA-binding protein H-NS